MSLTKWILTTAVILPLSLLGSGAAFVAHQAQAIEPAGPTPVPVAPTPAAGESNPGVVLEWKFEKDRPFYQEVTTETKQTMSILAKDVTQTQKQTFLFRWTPRGQDKDGNWVLTQKIEGVKMDMDIGGHKIEFDSAKEGNVNTSLWEFYKALIGAEFQVTLDKEFKVHKVEGRDALFKKLSESNPATVTLFPQVLSSYAMSQMTGTSFTALLEGPVRPGDSWTRKNRVNLGPIGEYQTEFKYIYEGKRDRLHKINVNSTLELQLAAEGRTSLPFKIETNKLKGKGAGTIVFDRKKGRIVSQELDLKLEGKVTITSGTEANLLQWQQTRVKTTDENPIKLTLNLPQGNSASELERLRKENERLRRQLQAVEEALRQEGKPKK